MNGLASASSISQSLLQISENSAAGPVDTIGAGSTTTQPSESLPDSSSSIDQHLDSTATTNIIPNVPPALETQAPATGAQPEGGTAEVIDNRQDKGGAADKQATQPEPLAIKEEGGVLLESAVDGQIQLLEHTPESGVGAGEVGLIVNEEGQWVPDADHELKRVKVRKTLFI
jgi:protein phosphatase-4 regulatory subunit 3